MIPVARLLLALAVVLGACSTAASAETVELESLNGSGVSGTVSLTSVADALTRVEVRVVPGQNPDMPAHIHPGSCADLVPQPKYPLRNVVDGVSITEVPASLTELMAGGLAINLHRSNEDLGTYTACADLR